MNGDCGKILRCRGPGGWPLRGVTDGERAGNACRAYSGLRSQNTRRAYAGAWRTWLAFADEHNLPAMPARPADVAAFLAHRARTGAGMATLRMATAAMGRAHDLAGHSNPCRGRAVTETMRGLARQAAGRPQRQARALDSEAVAAIRGSLNGAVDRSHRAAVTMALASVMSDGGLRRSEAAALIWADIEQQPDGSGRLVIRKSKTDATGEGAVVAITSNAMRDLERIRRDAGDADRVFAMSERTIARRIASAAKAAGLGDGFSGHSGRVGLAARMVRNAAPAPAIMRRGRWASVRMISRYTRNEAAGEALRYL